MRDMYLNSSRILFFIRLFHDLFSEFAILVFFVNDKESVIATHADDDDDDGGGGCGCAISVVIS